MSRVMTRRQARRTDVKPSTGTLERAVRGFTRIHTRWFDALLALMLGAVAVLGLYIASRPGYTLLDHREPDQLAFALVVVQAVPLIWRRQSPSVVLGVILAATFAVRLLNYPLTSADLAGAVAFYTLASRSGFNRTVPGVLGVAGIVIPLTALGRITLLEFVLAHLLVVVAWALGDTVRRRGERILALERKTAAVQREQQQRINQAITDERIRIAQELHDLAAHALGVIAIQAQAASRGIVNRPEQARSSLNAISELADEALTDLRRLLGFLRSDGDELEARRPQPTLDEVEQLADGFRQAGLPVEIVIEGRRRRLSAALQTSAYRLIQESLTNSLKHAGRATALVAIRYGSDEIEIEVVDTGRGPAAHMRAGQGLTGMRERVTVFGGELRYGKGAHGGFVVHARLPIKQASAA